MDFKLHRVAKFNPYAWVKASTDMNTEITKKLKRTSKKILKLMNNSVFDKTKENMKKHKDTKPLKIEKRRKYLASEPNYLTKNFSLKTYYP